MCWFCGPSSYRTARSTTICRPALTCPRLLDAGFVDVMAIMFAAILFAHTQFMGFHIDLVRDARRLESILVYTADVEVAAFHSWGRNLVDCNLFTVEEIALCHLSQPSWSVICC